MLRKLPTSTFMSKWESLPRCFQICKNSFVYSITPFMYKMVRQILSKVSLHLFVFITLE